MAQQPGLKLHLVEDQFSCFQYTGKYDANLCHFLLFHTEREILYIYVIILIVLVFAFKYLICTGSPFLFLSCWWFQ